MFLKPGKSYSSRLDGIASRNEDIRKFLYYFEESVIFRYQILSKSEEIFIESGPKIAQEIETKKGKNKEDENTAR